MVQALRIRRPTAPARVSFMEPAVVQALDIARDIYGFPMVITSGFRTVEHNKKVGGSRQSSHLLGYAADIAVPNSERRFLLVEALLDAGFHRLGLGPDFVHVDLDPNSPTTHSGYISNSWNLHVKPAPFTP